jgi:hypothetical protein
MTNDTTDTVDVMATIRQYFKELLLPRSTGLIAIVENDRGLMVLLGFNPFLEMVFVDATIKVLACYPMCLARWNDRKQCWEATAKTTIKGFSKKPKIRTQEIASVRNFHLNGAKTIAFDIFEDDAIQRAEFYVQTIITRIKYMVGNNGYFGMQAKDDLDLTDPIEASTQDYNRLQLKHKRRK